MRALIEALNYVKATEGQSVQHFLDDHPENGEKLLADLNKKVYIFITDGIKCVCLTQAGNEAFQKGAK